MWTEAMVKLIRERFVAVAVAGHVANDRQDADGDFLRKIGVRLAGAGGNMECFTANGIRLGGFYAAGGSAVNEREAAETLRKFDELPDAERRPRAVKVPDQGPVAANVRAIQPPPGALILRTYHRLFSRDENGDLRKARVTDYPARSGLGQDDTWVTFFGEKWEAQPDFMWIRESEWKSLVKPNPKRGDRYPLHPALADRMTRAHLTLGMAYGECGICDRRDVRSSELTLTVTDVTKKEVRLRLEGAVELGADFATSEEQDKKGAETGQAVQGFEPRVLGELTYDRGAQRFTRFDVIALGDAFGTPSGAYHFYYRAGRYPVGISMELLSGDEDWHRVPPRAAVIYDTPNPEYLSTGRR